MIARWERYTAGPPPPKSDRLYVSLNPRGIILLNRRIYDQFGAPEFVVLLFDRQQNMIGLSPSHADVKDAFPVRARDGYWFIQGGVFCTHYSIRLDKTERFTQPEIDDEGILRLDLTKTTSAAQRYGRSRTKTATRRPRSFR